MAKIGRREMVRMANTVNCILIFLNSKHTLSEDTAPPELVAAIGGMGGGEGRGRQTGWKDRGEETDAWTETEELARESLSAFSSYVHSTLFSYYVHPTTFIQCSHTLLHHILPSFSYYIHSTTSY